MWFELHQMLGSDLRSIYMHIYLIQLIFPRIIYMASIVDLLRLRAWCSLLKSCLPFTIVIIIFVVNKVILLYFENWYGSAYFSFFGYFSFTLLLYWERLVNSFIMSGPPHFINLLLISSSPGDFLFLSCFTASSVCVSVTVSVRGCICSASVCSTVCSPLYSFWKYYFQVCWLIVYV